jgi:putative flippase GtrA
LVQELALESKGAMISAEILIRLTRSGIPVKEVPVSHLPRIHGSATGAKPSVILRAFKEMLRLYRGELGLASAHQEMLKFMLVGVVNTLIDVGLYFAFTRYTFLFSVHLIAAKFFSFLAGTISSLYLNRSWTFGIKDSITAREIVRFYSMVSISIVLDVVLMSLLVGAGMYDLLALVLTTGFVFVANFALSKLWVFKTEGVAPVTYDTTLLTHERLSLDSSVSEE